MDPARRRKAYLETNVIIRFVENEDPGLLFLFEQADAGVFELVTSELTLAEVLVTPLRENDASLTSIYEDFLTGDDGLAVVPIDRDILRRSAEIRATLGNKGPDAIHLATALAKDCSAFVSSDLRLRLPPTLKQIRIEHVQDLDRWP